jgi:hypothetical protein
MAKTSMNRGVLFASVSAIFWGLTFTLIGLIALAATVGSYGLVRIVLTAAGAYAVIGFAYGVWAALRATARVHRS